MQSSIYCAVRCNAIWTRRTTRRSCRKFLSVSPELQQRGRSKTLPTVSHSLLVGGRVGWPLCSRQMRLMMPARWD